jgi:signal transduction histidine kinase
VVVARYAGARVPVTVRHERTGAGGDAAGAGRYAKSSVAVSVGQAGESGESVELAVTDDGPGIPEAERERAFGRFARLDDARHRDGEDAGGAGLGLAIVRATAQAYGGTARLDATEPAPGLRALVRLPAVTFTP